jgi:IS5 family transposase
MRQQSFAADQFEKYRVKTRKEIFLVEMDRIIPWKALSKVIKPYYPKPKDADRRPIGIQRMLHIHYLQHWFELSDPGAEEALYDSRAMRQFVGIDLGKEPVRESMALWSASPESGTVAWIKMRSVFLPSVSW